jgi:hypothetical protein
MTDQDEQTNAVPANPSPQIPPHNDHTLKLIVVGGLVVIAILIVAACLIISINDSSYKLEQQKETAAATVSVIPASTPTPTPTPTAVPAVISYTTPITFTVLKASAAQINAVNDLDRMYTVLTTDGTILIFSDYYSWDAMIPQQSYTCTITSAPTAYGRTAYTVSSCYPYKYQNYVQVIYNDDNTYYPYDKYHYYNRNTGEYQDEVDYYKDNDIHGNHYVFYHYNKQYWRCAAGTCDSIGIGSVPAYETINEATPPFSRKD